MPHDEHEPADGIPHPPRRPVSVEAEGFDSSGAGRDIFFAAVQTLHMPVAVADPRLPDMPLVFVNHAFCEMTGYAREEILGRNCRFLQGPETDAATVDRLREAVAARDEVTVELLNYRKNGSAFWNALFLTPVRDVAGELIYYFSSQLDVTRRRDTEAALRQTQKMEALGQLTGGIAHDFNNLLQIVMGNIDVATVRARVLGLSDPVLDKALRNMKDATHKSGQLTQKLLAFARKQQLQGRVVDLNELLAGFAGPAQRILGSRGRWRLETEPALWNARIDAAQAELALSNLLANARDAMPRGGDVVVRTFNVDADAASAAAHGLPQPGRYVLVAVSDPGVGIPAAVLPRVMDPFFTTKPSGTGLGLSMVYGFAKQSGGVATIYSEDGHGTTIRLYFPALVEADAAGPAPAQAPAAAPAPAPASAAGGPARIAIVDDRVEIARLAADMLSAAGYVTEAFSSPDDALQRLAQAPPVDLLLTDLIMPGAMNGVVLARLAQQRTPGLKVLLMTGFADDSLGRWGGEGYGILFKPFAASELETRVARALAQD